MNLYHLTWVLLALVAFVHGQAIPGQGLGSGRVELIPGEIVLVNESGAQENETEVKLVGSSPAPEILVANPVIPIVYTKNATGHDEHHSANKTGKAHNGASGLSPGLFLPAMILLASASQLIFTSSRLRRQPKLVSQFAMKAETMAR